MGSEVDTDSNSTSLALLLLVLLFWFGCFSGVEVLVLGLRALCKLCK